jgi:hypothetical protein
MAKSPNQEGSQYKRRTPMILEEDNAVTPDIYNEVQDSKKLKLSGVNQFFVISESKIKSFQKIR